MNDDRILEFMASVSEHMQNTDRRFEQLINVMHDGFGRVTGQLQELNGRVDKLTERVDKLTERVDKLTEEMAEVKQDIREMKTEAQATNRRLNATFDQAGYLTEQDTAIALRVTHVEQGQQPTNGELHQRLLTVENKLNKAS